MVRAPLSYLAPMVMVMAEMVMVEMSKMRNKKEASITGTIKMLIIVRGPESAE